jgi:hypothetical protein
MGLPWVSKDGPVSGSSARADRAMSADPKARERDKR